MTSRDKTLRSPEVWCRGRAGPYRKEAFPSMGSRHHDQVEFTDIPRSYSAGADIQLNLQISSQFPASQADRVGIFRVGWSTARDALHFEVVQLPDGYTSGYMAGSSVTFPAAVLPEDDGEFYQFCYMNGNLHACGVSKPFQFRKPDADDFLETEEADMLIVTSKAVAQEERLTKMNAQLCELRELNTNLEENRKKLVEMLTHSNEQQQLSNATIEGLRADVSALLAKIKELEMLAADLKKAYDQQVESISESEQEKRDLERKIEALQEEIACLRSERCVLRNDLDGMRGRVVMLSSERELFQGQLRTTESAQKAHADELNALRRQIEALRADCAGQQARTKLLDEDLLAERRKCEHFYQISNADKTALERLRERCEHAEDKLTAAESCKLMYAAEITSLNETLASLKQKLEDSANENYAQKQALQQVTDRISKMASERELTSAENAMALKYAQEEKQRLTGELDALRASSDEERRSADAERCRHRKAESELLEEVAKLQADGLRLHADLKRSAAATSADRQDLLDGMAALRSEHDSKLAALRDLESANGQLQTAVADLKVRLQQGEREWVSLHREKEVLKRKLGRSRSTGSDSWSAEGSEGFAGREGSGDRHDDRHVEEPGIYDLTAPPSERVVNTSSALLRDASTHPQVYIRYPGGRCSPIGSTNGDDLDLADHARAGASARDRNTSEGTPMSSSAPDNVDLERYYDVSEGASIDRCCICRRVFDDDWSTDERTQHVNAHLAESDGEQGKRCPMCNHQFPVDCDQVEFETHVNEHFNSYQ